MKYSTVQGTTESFLQWKDFVACLNWRNGDRTKWYGQNDSNFYRFQFNWIEFLFCNHKSEI